jgi:hypothetical protein
LLSLSLQQNKNSILNIINTNNKNIEDLSIAIEGKESNMIIFNKKRNLWATLSPPNH